MNKTIIINISGTIFHIEEDAYDILRNYMSDVKRYFGDSSDSFEIVTDIENRVAELFTEILTSKSSQVIVAADVEQVIGQMGRTKDFDTEGSKTPNAAEEKPASRRKLYRDTEDKVLGGVCSGLGYYFGADAVWIRVIFTVLLFAGGFAFIAYIVLWIAMPAARTRAERLAMAGEKVNLETLRNSVQNELSEVRERFTKYGRDIRSGAASSRLGDFIEEFFSLAGGVFSIIGKIVLIAIGIVAIMAGAALLLGSLATFIAVLVSPEHIWFNGPVFFDLSPSHMVLADVSVMLALSIPALLLIVVGIRLLVRRSIMNSVVARTLLLLWFFALIGCIWTGLDIARMFSNEASITQEVPLQPVASKTFYLKPGESTVDADSSYSSDFEARKRHNWHIRLGHREFQSRVEIEVKRQDTGRAVLEEIFTSRGRDTHDALKHADKIRYHFEQKDSVLIFPKSISWAKDQYRGQQAKVILNIPTGTTVIADPDLQDIYLANLDDYEREDGKNNIFIMTSEGLKPKFLKRKRDSEDIRDNEDSSMPNPPKVPKAPAPPAKAPEER